MTVGAIWISYESLGTSLVFFAAHAILPILFSSRARENIATMSFQTLLLIKKPKVTVIIPSHNCVTYLDQAVQSALSSVGVKVKVLIVDDASTDGSLELAEKLSREDNRVQVIKNKRRRGAYFCRNIGLLKVSTEFIAFLDSDDVHDKTRLILQITPMIKNTQLQATYCLTRRWAEDLSRPIEAQLGLCEASSVFRKGLVSRVGFFDVVSFGSDTEFRTRLISIFGEQGVELINIELYKARAHPNSLTASGAGKKWTLIDGAYTRTLNQTRFRYQLNYRSWHALEKNLFLGFPIRERLFPGGDVDHESSPFLGQRVVGFMVDDSTSVKKTKSSILSILPQVDELHIFTRKTNTLTSFSTNHKIRLHDWRDQRDLLVFNKQVDESQGYILFFNCRKKYSYDHVNRILSEIEVSDRISYVNFKNDYFLINPAANNMWNSKNGTDPVNESQLSRPNPVSHREIGFHSQTIH